MYSSGRVSDTVMGTKAHLLKITVSYNRLVARCLMFGESYKMKNQSDQLNNEITIDSLVI